MRTTTATLLLLSAIGCGGAREKSREPTEPIASAPEATTPAEAPAAESPAPAADQSAATATPASAPEAATPAAASASASTASAELKMVSGDKSLGTITFEQKDKVVSINGQFSGLKKGQHALYIHTKGDCSAKAKNVGAHLNPTKAKHGPPASAMRHAGDFGDLTFDKEGNATFAMETDSVTMEPGRADSVVGRSVVVYSKKDSKSGKAGSPIACGVIAAAGAGAATETRSSYSAPSPTPTASSSPR